MGVGTVVVTLGGSFWKGTNIDYAHRGIHRKEASFFNHDIKSKGIHRN